jgi:OHCU decarboxylase
VSDRPTFFPSHWVPGFMSAAVPAVLSSLSPSELEPVLGLLLNAPSSSLPVLARGTCERLQTAEGDRNGVSLSYGKLLRQARTTLDAWSRDQRAGFVHGHPRIGAVAGLEGLSQQEQSDRGTSPEILQRENLVQILPKKS